MTAPRLREIASRVEQVCIELRKAMSGQTVPCDGCRRAAEDLRDLAKEIGPPENAAHRNQQTVTAHFSARTARRVEAND